MPRAAAPGRLLLALTLSLAGLGAAREAQAVRVWEEPRRDWTPPPEYANLAPGLPPSLAAMFVGSAASPDLRASDNVTPLAAGGHVGASRYPAGVAERWLDIGFFSQPRFAATYGYDPNQTSNFAPPPGFSLARTRLVVHGQAHPLLQVRLEVDISDRVTLLDAYGLVPIFRWLQLQLGQFRVPFSRQAQVSSTRYQFADGSLWQGGASVGNDLLFVPGFDLGAMVWGWAGPRDIFEYYLGVWNGKGANQLRNIDSFFLYGGRVAVNPLGRGTLQEGAWSTQRPVLSIGLNMTHQLRQIGTVDLGMGAIPNRLYNTRVGADVHFAYWGASLYGELYYHNQLVTDTRPMSTPSTESLGWLVQAGFFIPWAPLRDHLELVARVQSFNPSTCLTRAEGNNCGVRYPSSQTPNEYRDLMWTTAMTFGVNWYQSGHGFKIHAAYTLNYENRGLANMMADPSTGVVNNDQFVLQITGSF